VPPAALATAPFAATEAERVGSEERDQERRWARRRKVAVRLVAAIGGIAVVAGGVWIWTTTRNMPPYEAWSTPLPRASLPPAETTAATTTAAGGVQEPTATVTTPAEGSGTVPGGVVTRAPHQRWSWSISAMGTLESARSLSERLRRSAPAEAFMVAPVVSGGRTLYRVLGGLAQNQQQLSGTREALGRATGLASGGWLARETPFAFALRDFEDGGAAATWAGELWGEGIPAYVLVVERDDGSTVHRVYSGAYASAEEAAPLRAVLENAGIGPGTLSERRGRAGS
jgi:cell division septation protein DedD